MATGIKRVRPDLIVFTYQGDGDLARIGMSEIIHAANRGEKFTAIFINNAVYGMTGGQMAPTSMPGQRTTTSPFGRTTALTGMPVQMAELLSALETPAYIARAGPHQARVHQSGQEGRPQGVQLPGGQHCFSLVELVSTCPTNWGMTPVDALKWAEDKMLPYYPLGEYKTPERAG